MTNHIHTLFYTSIEFINSTQGGRVLRLKIIPVRTIGDAKNPGDCFAFASSPSKGNDDDSNSKAVGWVCHLVGRSSLWSDKNCN
jgi:hypothetical protein